MDSAITSQGMPDPGTAGACAGAGGGVPTANVVVSMASTGVEPFTSVSFRLPHCCVSKLTVLGLPVGLEEPTFI